MVRCFTCDTQCHGPGFEGRLHIDGPVSSMTRSGGGVECVVAFNGGGRDLDPALLARRPLPVPARRQPQPRAPRCGLVPCWASRVAGCWLTRKARYRERIARRRAARRHAGGRLNRQAAGQGIDECRAIPKRRVNAKTKPCLVVECLGFLGVASPGDWRTHYLGMECALRRSGADQCAVGAISEWLRLGEQEAEKLGTWCHDQSAFQAALDEIRVLMLEPPEVFEPRVRALLRRGGVGFVLVPAIPRARVSGVARWSSPLHPLVQLSPYGKTSDKFWLSFFHEAAHILLHASAKKPVWLDDTASGQVTGSAGQTTGLRCSAGGPPGLPGRVLALPTSPNATASAMVLG